MKAIPTTFLTVALIMTYHFTVSAQNSAVPFTASSPSSASPALQPTIISFSASINDNKVSLNWIVDQNQDADQFEVERSMDGKNFKMAALVFGTDKPDTANYKFFERTKESNLSYRIKIFYKNGTADYSPVIKAEAANK
jgi:hypothetical protein